MSHVIYRVAHIGDSEDGCVHEHEHAPSMLLYLRADIAHMASCSPQFLISFSATFSMGIMVTCFCHHLACHIGNCMCLCADAGDVG